MAALTIPGHTNYDCLIGQSLSATIDTYAVSNYSTLLIDTDTRYCCSHTGAAASSNGSFDTVSAGMTGKVSIDGTAVRLIPYKSGSGTAPNLYLALAISTLTWSGGVATCTTAAHGLTSDTNVTIRIAGVTGATITQGYNGLFHGVVTSSTVIKYPLTNDPGASTITNGRMVAYYKVYQAVGGALIPTVIATTGGSAPYLATFTVAGHGLAVNDFVIVAGVTPAAYNGNWQVQSITTDTFTVWMNTTQGAGSVFGTTTKQVFGYLLGWFSSFTAIPVPTGTTGTAAIPTPGYCKIKSASGAFSAGTINAEYGTAQTAAAIGPDVAGWIEVVSPLTGTCSVSRLSRFETIGGWYYPVSIPQVSTSITRSGVTATLTKVAHGLTNGDIVTITGASPNGYNGTYTIANVAADTFDYTMGADPGASASTQGDFTAVLTTSGVANQTVQFPAPITNTFYAGVWVETGVGTNTYEFYPSCNIAAAVGTVATNSAQGKLVWFSAQGLLRIGNDGTNNNGYVPASGLRIRVPTILTSGTTKAASVGAQTNAALPATLTGRYTMPTTGVGAVISLNGVTWNWNSTFAQAYSVSVVNTAFVDGIGAISEIATPMTFTNVGIGTSGSGTNAVASFAFSLCFAGGTFTDFIVGGHVATSGTTVQNKCTLTDCFSFIFSNLKIQTYPIRRSATSANLFLTRVNNSTFTTYKSIGAPTSLVQCKNITFTTNSYADLTSGTTTSTTPCYWWSLATACDTVKIDGMDFFGQANVNPYLGIFTILSASSNIKIRNMGSAASPLSLGPTNAAGSFLVGAANAGSANLEIKRVYCSAPRTANPNAIFSTVDNSYSGILMENGWFDAADTFTALALNSVMKGLRSTNVTTLQAAIYGSHFQDYFPSTTTGKLVIAAHEKTTAEPSASSYTIDVQGTGCGFNSNGSFYMPNVADQITWTHPFFIIGHTSFGTAVCTETINALTTNTSIDLTYDIDKGAGFSGSFKNLSYKRAGGGGSGGSSTVTMTNTTGVAVNDYVYGTNVGVAAKVNSVDSGTNITVSVVNGGTVSGVLKFNQLPNEASINALTGFKLKVRAKPNTAATTNLLQFIDIPTVADTTSQAYQYPLDPVTVAITVKSAATSAVVSGARVLVEAAAGGTLPAGASVTITSASTTATVTHTNHGLTNGNTVIIRGANEGEYNGSRVITVTGASSYTYTISGSPASPATGTITGTVEILNALTDANGLAQTTIFPYTASQPVSGKVRKGTAVPRYRTGIISGTITSTGFSTTVFVVSDD